MFLLIFHLNYNFYRKQYITRYYPSGQRLQFFLLWLFVALHARTDGTVAALPNHPVLLLHVGRLDVVITAQVPVLREPVGRGLLVLREDVLALVDVVGGFIHVAVLEALPQYAQNFSVHQPIINWNVLY